MHIILRKHACPGFVCFGISSVQLRYYYLTLMQSVMLCTNMKVLVVLARLEETSERGGPRLEIGTDITENRQSVRGGGGRGWCYTNIQTYGLFNYKNLKKNIFFAIFSPFNMFI